MAWDTFSCHIEDSVTDSLKRKKVDEGLVPGGCTPYIQGPDVSWNKPFKAHCTDSYDDWLANKGLTEETACGNLKAPPRREVVLWILAAWESLSKEMIRDSFVSCAITCATDGSQDDEITCIQPNVYCIFHLTHFSAGIQIAPPISALTFPNPTYHLLVS